MEALAAIPISFAVAKLRRFKVPLILSFVVYCVGVGVMFVVRKPGGHIGFIILSQLLVGAAGATFKLLDTLAIVSANPTKDPSPLLAVLMMFSSVGGAIGNGLSSAVWTNTLPKLLQKLLPEEAKPDWQSIYDSIYKQLEYEDGSDVRRAIQEAYVEAQKRMLIGGMVAMIGGLFSIALMRNHEIPDEQTENSPKLEQETGMATVN